MTKDWVKPPKRVLIFNGNRTLIGMARSVLAASQITGSHMQAVANVCVGRYISSEGLYFRHIEDDIIIDMSDLGTLKLEEYDELCGYANRNYRTSKAMFNARNRFLKRVDKTQLSKKKKKTKENE